MVSKPADPMYDFNAAAAYLGMTPRWVRKAWQEHRLRGYKMGRLVRFRQSDLEKLLADAEVPAQ